MSGAGELVFHALLQLAGVMRYLRSCTAASTQLSELVAAERAFAARSEASSTQAAFLSVLADDAIMFRPGAVNARESLRQRPFNPNGLLRWMPLLGDIAESGELGYTTGPCEAGLRGEAPTYKGQFVSIWQRIGIRRMAIAG
ncbi:MAG: hypothetical protein WEE89_04410 [Gemmatimonadota bacterium]